MTGIDTGNGYFRDLWMPCVCHWPVPCAAALGQPEKTGDRDALLPQRQVRQLQREGRDRRRQVCALQESVVHVAVGQECAWRKAGAQARPGDGREADGCRSCARDPARALRAEETR